jgi:hypothetical protein
MGLRHLRALPALDETSEKIEDRASREPRGVGAWSRRHAFS